MSDRHTPDETSDGPGSPVRPYVMTEGREGANTVQLDMISVVIAVRGEVDELSLEPEQLAILDLCHRPLSVAEVSARLDIPVAVVKVLMGDLITRGYMLARAPYTIQHPVVVRDVLTAVLDGIQRL